MKDFQWVFHVFKLTCPINLFEMNFKFRVTLFIDTVYSSYMIRRQTTKFNFKNNKSCKWNGIKICYCKLDCMICLRNLGLINSALLKNNNNFSVLYRKGNPMFSSPIKYLIAMTFLNEYHKWLDEKFNLSRCSFSVIHRVMLHPFHSFLSNEVSFSSWSKKCFCIRQFA